jgi:hypothetical protein
MLVPLATASARERFFRRTLPTSEPTLLQFVSKTSAPSQVLGCVKHCVRDIRWVYLNISFCSPQSSTVHIERPPYEHCRLPSSPTLESFDTFLLCVITISAPHLDSKDDHCHSTSDPRSVTGNHAHHLPHRRPKTQPLRNHPPLPPSSHPTRIMRLPIYHTRSHLRPPYPNPSTPRLRHHMLASTPSTRPPPSICRSCITRTVASRLGLPSTAEITQKFGTEMNLALGMLDFFVEYDVEKLKDAGQRDAKVIEKTEEEVMTTEKCFWGRQPETEKEKMEALEYVFRGWAWGIGRFDWTSASRWMRGLRVIRKRARWTLNRRWAGCD